MLMRWIIWKIALKSLAKSVGMVEGKHWDVYY